MCQICDHKTHLLNSRTNLTFKQNPLLSESNTHRILALALSSTSIMRKCTTVFDIMLSGSGWDAVLKDNVLP